MDRVFLGLEGIAVGLKRTAMSLGRLLFALKVLESGPKFCCRGRACPRTGVVGLPWKHAVGVVLLDDVRIVGMWTALCGVGVHV